MVSTYRVIQRQRRRDQPPLEFSTTCLIVSWTWFYTKIKLFFSWDLMFLKKFRKVRLFLSKWLPRVIVQNTVCHVLEKKQFLCSLPTDVSKGWSLQYTYWKSRYIWRESTDYIVFRGKSILKDLLTRQKHWLCASLCYFFNTQSYVRFLLGDCLGLFL